MNFKEYIRSLNRAIREAEKPEEAKKLATKRAYAYHHMQGTEALDKYRDKLIAEKINAVVDRDAQLAILFNKDMHPDEYEAYQALRLEKKAEADTEMAELKAELENELNSTTDE